MLLLFATVANAQFYARVGGGGGADGSAAGWALEQEVGARLPVRTSLDLWLALFLREHLRGQPLSVRAPMGGMTVLVGETRALRKRRPGSRDRATSWLWQGGFSAGRALSGGNLTSLEIVGGIGVESRQPDRAGLGVLLQARAGGWLDPSDALQRLTATVTLSGLVTFGHGPRELARRDDLAPSRAARVGNRSEVPLPDLERRGIDAAFLGCAGGSEVTCSLSLAGRGVPVPVEIGLPDGQCGTAEVVDDLGYDYSVIGAEAGGVAFTTCGTVTVPADTSVLVRLTVTNVNIDATLFAVLRVSLGFDGIDDRIWLLDVPITGR